MASTGNVDPNKQAQLLTQIFSSGKRVGYDSKNKMFVVASKGHPALTQADLQNKVSSFIDENSNLINKTNLEGLSKAIEGRRKNLEDRGDSLLFKWFADDLDKTKLAQAVSALSTLSVGIKDKLAAKTQSVAQPPILEHGQQRADHGIASPQAQPRIQAEAPGAPPAPPMAAGAPPPPPPPGSIPAAPGAMKPKPVILLKGEEPAPTTINPALGEKQLSTIVKDPKKTTEAQIQERVSQLQNEIKEIAAYAGLKEGAKTTTGRSQGEPVAGVGLQKSLKLLEEGITKQKELQDTATDSKRELFNLFTERRSILNNLEQLRLLEEGKVSSVKVEIPSGKGNKIYRVHTDKFINDLTPEVAKQMGYGNVNKLRVQKQKALENLERNNRELGLTTNDVAKGSHLSNLLEGTAHGGLIGEIETELSELLLKKANDSWKTKSELNAVDRLAKNMAELEAHKKEVETAAGQPFSSFESLKNSKTSLFNSWRNAYNNRLNALAKLTSGKVEVAAQVEEARETQEQDPYEVLLTLAPRLKPIVDIANGRTAAAPRARRDLDVLVEVFQGRVQGLTRDNVPEMADQIVWKWDDSYGTVQKQPDEFIKKQTMKA